MEERKRRIEKEIENIGRRIEKLEERRKKEITKEKNREEKSQRKRGKDKENERNGRKKENIIIKKLKMKETERK